MKIKKRLRHISTLVITFMIINIILSIPVFADSNNIETLSASYSSGKIAVSGTTEDGVLAVAVLIYDKDGSTILRMETFGVTSNNFSASISISLSPGTYLVKAADYEGGIFTETRFTYTAPSGESGGSNGNETGGESNPKPIYKASLTGDTGKSIDFKVEVDEKLNTCKTSLNTEEIERIFSSNENQVITMPSINGLDDYILDLPGDSLDSTQKKNELTLATDIGSIVIPDNMLSNIENLNGKVASIAIGRVDNSSLSKEVKVKIGNHPIIQLSLNVDGEKTSWNNPNASVKVSIPYSPTIDELKNPEQIVIWYIDGSGNPVSVPNGRYDGASGNVIFTTNHFSYYAVNFNKMKFNDVAENAWYKTPVGFIAAREITTGTGNGKFSPELKLTRGQFIVMMMKAYDIAPSGNLDNNFTDSGNTYYTDYLGEAKRIGIAAGVGNNMFLPEREISRQEMFTMLYRALKEIDQLPEDKSNSKLEDFNDLAQIDSWAKDAIKLFVESNIIKGSNGKLKPLDLTSRAEMAQILYNLLSKQNASKQ